MIFYPFILSYCTEKDSLFYLFFQLQVMCIHYIQQGDVCLSAVPKTKRQDSGI